MGPEGFIADTLYFAAEESFYRGSEALKSVTDLLEESASQSYGGDLPLEHSSPDKDGTETASKENVEKILTRWELEASG